MAIHQGRTVPAKTVVLSKDGSAIFEVDVDGFFHLVKQGIVKLHGSDRKIHRLQLTVEVEQAGIDDPRFRDPIFNKKYTRLEHVSGCWYIHQLKMIPKSLKPVFTAVLDSVTVAA